MTTKPPIKHPVIITILSVLLAVGGTLAVALLTRNTRFTLSEEFYGSSEIVSTTADHLRSEIDAGKSFLVFISQPGCRTAEKLEANLASYLDQQKYRAYELDFSVLRSSGLADAVKYYPSLLIYHDGKLVDFLDANDDADADAFTSREVLTSWLEQYIQPRG